MDCWRWRRCSLDAATRRRPAEATEAATPVTVEPAVRGAIDHLITADAVLYPIDQATISSRIGAPVRRVLVNRGDHVRAGQLLMELDSRDLAATEAESKQLYDQAQAVYQTTTGATVPEDRTKAQADFQSAQQALDAAKKLYENRVTLVREGALAQRLADDAKVAMVQAQSQLETARRHLEALNQVSQRQTIIGAEAQMKAAQARYQNAAVQLSYAQIRSPIKGVVSDRPIYQGEMAASGSPLVSIVDISQIVARANVPVKEAAYIRVGRPARIAGPEGDIGGQVTVVSPAVDPSTTTVEVWIKANNPGEVLKPGSTAHVTIVADTIQNTIDRARHGAAQLRRGRTTGPGRKLRFPCARQKSSGRRTPGRSRPDPQRRAGRRSGRDFGRTRSGR